VPPFAEAEIVAVKLDLTFELVARKLAVVIPSGTSTLGGTVTSGSLLLKITVVPPADAAPSILTVPLDVFPATTVFGLNTTDIGFGSLTVKLAVFALVPSLAVIIAVVLAVTITVFTVKVAVVEPSGTVTEAGTDATLLLLVSSTIVPAGAEASRVILPIDEFPPATFDGLRDNAVKIGGLTVIAADTDGPPDLSAVMVAVSAFKTGLVEIVNVPDCWPDVMFMLAGTVAMVVSELERSIPAVSPFSTGPLSVTVTVE
jgi:hypothetical protein